MKADQSQGNRTGFVAFLRRHPWLTAALAIVLLLGALYIAVEWRAERRWQHYAAEARARGARLHFEDFPCPDVTEANNFLALALLQIPEGEKTQGSRFALPPGPRAPNRAGLGPLDWKALQQYFQSIGYIVEVSGEPVRDVLRALEHHTSHFQQWSEWRTTRTQSLLPTETGWTVISNLSEAVVIFNLRMRAHLAIGDSAAAYADFQDGMQAPRALRDDPRGLGDRRRAMYLPLVDSVAVGLRDHSWADPELKKLEADLSMISLWDDYCLTMDGERCNYIKDMEKRMNTSARGRVARARDLWNGDAPSRTATLLEMLTRSIFRDNELRLNRRFDEMTARGSGPDHTFEPGRSIPSAPEYLTSSFAKEYYRMGGYSGEFIFVERQYIDLQILFDQTRLACALERFRLARGAFPKTLEVLTPEFISTLPNDPYARAPYHYRPVGKDRFLLYSVWLNRKDDGGQYIPSASDRSDLTWTFEPAPAAP